MSVSDLETRRKNRRSARPAIVVSSAGAIQQPVGLSRNTPGTQSC